MHDSTRLYYSENAALYASQTCGLDMAEIRAEFSCLVQPGGQIMDAGCGSGRDVLAFSQQGFKVVAFDGSAELASIAKAYAEQDVLTLQFKQIGEMPWAGRFDGVWACASLLHLDDASLDNALRVLIACLRPGGVLFMCFKAGHECRTDWRGRFFNDFTIERLSSLPAFDQGALIRSWTTTTSTGAEDQFLNVLMRRPESGKNI